MNKKPDKQTDEILEHEEAMIPEEEIEAVDEKVEDYDETGDIVDEGYLDKAAKDNMEALRIENQHLKDEYLRALADAENTKKRCAQEIEKNTKYAISSFAKSLLNVADNLHRAIEAATDNAENCKDLLKGVELTEAELMKVFSKHGISKMEIMGTVFDPNFHQVVQEVEDKTKPNGTIIAELQTGYMINDRILREAMVVVSKGGK